MEGRKQVSDEEGEECRQKVKADRVTRLSNSIIPSSVITRTTSSSLSSRLVRLQASVKLVPYFRAFEAAKELASHGTSAGLPDAAHLHTQM